MRGFRNLENVRYCDQRNFDLCPKIKEKKVRHSILSWADLSFLSNTWRAVRGIYYIKSRKSLQGDVSLIKIICDIHATD